MRQSGRAVRELLAVMAGIRPADWALAELELTASKGGPVAVANVRKLVQLGREAGVDRDTWRRRADQAAFELALAQASLRAMVGQPLPEDARQVMDPPAGHHWGTGGQVEERIRVASTGRLYCATCTLAAPAGVVLASECLERARTEAGS